MALSWSQQEARHVLNMKKSSGLFQLQASVRLPQALCSFIRVRRRTQKDQRRACSTASQRLFKGFCDIREWRNRGRCARGAFRRTWTEADATNPIAQDLQAGGLPSLAFLLRSRLVATALRPALLSANTSPWLNNMLREDLIKFRGELPEVSCP